MVGRQGQHRLQQQLGVVEHVAGHADLGQQPHGFRVVAVPQQKGADDLLGRRQVAVGEQRGRGHHLRRQCLSVATWAAAVAAFFASPVRR